MDLGSCSYAVSNETEFKNLLKRFGGIMNIEDQLIPRSFESLIDGGRYATVTPPANDDLERPARNPQEDLLCEDAAEQEDSNDDDTRCAKPSPKARRDNPKKGNAERAKRKARNASTDATNLAAKRRKIDRRVQSAERLFENGNYEKALENYQTALLEQQVVDGEESLSVARTFLDIGESNLALGRSKEALDAYENALEIIGTGHDGGNYDFPQLYYKMGNLYKNHHQYKEAKEKYEEALNILTNEDERVATTSKAQVATTIADLGSILDDMGNYTEAIERYNEALRIRRKLFGDNHLDVAAIYELLGISLNKLEDFDQAFKMHNEALKIREKLKSGDPIVAKSHNLIGNVLVNQKKYKEAEKEYHLALSIQIDNADLQNDIGHLYSIQGKHTKAIAAFQKALREQRKEDCPLDIAHTYFNMGCVYENMKDYDAAMKKYNEAMKMYRNMGEGQNDPAMADTLNSMGRICRCQEKYSEAMRMHKEACGIQRESLGDRHVDVGETYSLMGDVLNDEGSYDEALNHYEKALSIYENIYGAAHEKRRELTEKVGDLRVMADNSM